MSPRPRRRFRVILTDTVVYTRHLTAKSHTQARETAERLFDEQGTDAFGYDQRYTYPDITIEELVS